jgi:hypothetical protein
VNTTKKSVKRGSRITVQIQGTLKNCSTTNKNSNNLANSKVVDLLGFETIINLSKATYDPLSFLDTEIKVGLKVAKAKMDQKT